MTESALSQSVHVCCMRAEKTVFPKNVAKLIEVLLLLPKQFIFSMHHLAISKALLFTSAENEKTGSELYFEAPNRGSISVLLFF